MFKSFEHAYSQAFMKLFRTSDINVVKQCQFYCGCLPIELKIIYRKFNFHRNLLKSSNYLCRFINNLKVDNELHNICLKYNSTAVSTQNNIKQCLWNYFFLTVELILCHCLCDINFFCVFCIYITVCCATLCVN